MNTNWKKQITIFLTSQAVTLFGSSLVQFAIVWFVTKETSSGFWVSMLTVCAYLPIGMIVFGPLSDVLSMRWIMVFSGIALICLGMYTSHAKNNVNLNNIQLRN